MSASKAASDKISRESFAVFEVACTIAIVPDGAGDAPAAGTLGVEADVVAFKLAMTSFRTSTTSSCSARAAVVDVKLKT